MKIKFCVLFFGILAVLLPGRPTKAMDCYVDPVREYSGSGKIVSAVFMRDNACVQGTTILTTLAVNSAVNVLGFTDGWYYVEYNGNRGWIGSQFLGGSMTASSKVWSSYQDFMQAYPSHKAAAAVTPTPTVTPTIKTDPALVSRFLGYILLDVQSHGEAWYLNPTSGYRYYMKDGAVAYEMMRSFGLGVTEADYQRLVAGNWTLLNRLRGRIVLRAQAHGEAYYIHPKTLAVHYLKDGPAAYEVMRYYSQGMASVDLARIPTKEVPVIGR